jgi:festuclavine dehydrogenase
MTILLTGGTGKTSLHLASLLKSTSTPFLLASRSSQNAHPSYPHVKFDWLDPLTFAHPFQHKQRITAIYLIAPNSQDCAGLMNSFIDLAMEKGVRRFVMLTGSSSECGASGVGMVWKYLVEKEVEWCVLRATWFMGMFSPSEMTSV